MTVRPTARRLSISATAAARSWAVTHEEKCVKRMKFWVLSLDVSFERQSRA